MASVRTINGVWPAAFPGGHVNDYVRGLMTQDGTYCGGLSDKLCAERVRATAKAMALGPNGKESRRCMTGKDRQRRRLMIQRLHWEHDKLRADGLGNDLGPLTYAELMKAYCSLQYGTGVAELLATAHARGVPPYDVIYVYAARTYARCGMFAPLLSVWRLSLEALDDVCCTLPLIVIRALVACGRHGSARRVLEIMRDAPEWRRQNYSGEAALIACETPEEALRAMDGFTKVLPRVFGYFAEICRKHADADTLETFLARKRHLMTDMAVVALTQIMLVHAAANNVERVEFYFKKIAEPDEVASYALIDAYTRAGQYEAAMATYTHAQMRFEFLSYRCRYAGLRAGLLHDPTSEFVARTARALCDPYYAQAVRNVLPMLKADSVAVPDDICDLLERAAAGQAGTRDRENSARNLLEI